jgi:hypothetical protein
MTRSELHAERRLRTALGIVAMEQQEAQTPRLRDRVRYRVTPSNAILAGYEYGVIVAVKKTAVPAAPIMGRVRWLSEELGREVRESWEDLNDLMVCNPP